jgi:hypothetical protein
LIEKDRFTARQPDYQSKCEGEDDERRDYEVVGRNSPCPSRRWFVRHA